MLTRAFFALQAFGALKTDRRSEYTDSCDQRIEIGNSAKKAPFLLLRSPGALNHHGKRPFALSTNGGRGSSDSITDPRNGIQA